MNSFRFGTAINCIDGRTQQVVIDHLKQNHNIDGVDMVTFPGADEFFSNREHSEEIALIRRAVSISIEKHGSRIIAEVGHYDCAGNPGDRERHYMHIRRARCVKCPHGIYMHKSLDFMSMTSERLRK
jgi:hypothetical protein